MYSVGVAPYVQPSSVGFAVEALSAFVTATVTDIAVADKKYFNHIFYIPSQAFKP